MLWLIFLAGSGVELFILSTVLCQFITAQILLRLYSILLRLAWCHGADLNRRPRGYESRALTT